MGTSKSNKDDDNLSMETYISGADKANDNLSSAYVLIGVGVLGLIFMTLGFSGVFSFRIGNRFIFYGVMASVFILFIIMGIVSFFNARTYRAVANDENNLKKELDNWVAEKLTKEYIDSNIYNFELLEEEELYFDRVEIIKILIKRDFLNIDELFLDRYVDEIVYDKIFG